MNEILVRTIHVLCEDVVYNAVSMYMLKEGMELNEAVFRSVDVLCEFVVYIEISMYRLN